MAVLDGNDSGGRSRGRRTSRPRCAPLAVVLLALLAFSTVFGVVALTGAALAGDSAQVLAARMALGQAALYAPDGGAFDLFGSAAALSGETALMGAPGHAAAGKSFAGAAYVFTRSGGIWTAPTQLVAPDGAAAGDFFGESVAISGDTALIGASGHAVAGTAGAGAAYVFTRSGGSWTRQATLTAADGAKYDSLATSIALFGDTALIGAPQKDVAGVVNAGAAYVFTRSGGSWTQQATLTAPDGAVDDGFGLTVSLSGDTALIGAPRHATAGQARAGAAYIFTRSGGSWTQQQKLTLPDAVAVDEFGSTVALSGDTALVGAPFRDTAGQVDTGAVYVFSRAAGIWIAPVQLTAGDGAGGDQFGRSVALSGDTALVGAFVRDTRGIENAGAAYVFTRAGRPWTQLVELTAPDGAAGDIFGNSVALSGETALVGAAWHDTAGKKNAGAAYVFLTAPTVTSFLPTSGPVGATVTLTGSGFAEATAVAFNGVPAVFSVASDALLMATVPVGASSGTIAVTAPGGTGASAEDFTVIPAPGISRLKPAFGKRGVIVTISGSGFGAARGTSSVKFGARKCATYLSWSKTRVKCAVPAKAKYGAVKVVVTTAGGASNAKSFTVRR